MTELMGPEAAALQLDTFLPYRLAVLASLTAQALAVVHAAHGLTQAEWVILAAIAEQPRTTAKAIGATFHMQKAKVSRGVSALLRRKLINTALHRRDRRLVELQLTPEGGAIYRECAKAVAEFATDLESALAHADRAVLVRGLDRLAKAAMTLDVSGLAPAGGRF
ncbi:MAG: MarR family transcriptional regulator [Xanthobacteraceae bacterium]|nr:MarR family transcriptional regulator [Xanthobacteraceae bacterium]